MNPTKLIHSSARSARKMIVSGAVAAFAAGSAPAAVTDISGDLTQILDTVVGAGNSARLIDNTTTYWQANTSVSDIDLNGYEFFINTGNGNAQIYNGTISGPGSLRIRGRFDASWSPDAAFGGTQPNSPGSVLLNDGRATLGKSEGVDALAGPITVNVAAADWIAEIRLANNHQINDASTIDSTISTGLFRFMLDGYNEMIAGLFIKADHFVDTGDGGVLTLGALTVGGTSFNPGTYDVNNTGFVFGSGSVVVIPEPGSTALAALGLLALLRRKRR